MPEKKLMVNPLEKALPKEKAEPAEEVSVPPVETEKVEEKVEKVVEPVDAVETPPAAEESESEEKVDNPAKKSGKGTILVAEDEKPLSRALELKLTNQGYTVLTAFDGEDAVEKLKNNKVDLAILDIVMPKLDGFGVLAKIKELKLKVFSVVISNLSQDEDKKKAMDLGASQYFIKSDIPISDIVSFITKTLDA